MREVSSHRDAEFQLSEEQCQVLLRIARSGRTAQGVARRARAVLASAGGATDRQIAEELGTRSHTVRRWCSRFAESGLSGLEDRPRAGTPKRVRPESVERVIARALAEAPEPGAEWSTRAMARATGVSQATISRVWRSIGLRPNHSMSLRLLANTLLEGTRYRAIGLYVGEGVCAIAICCGRGSAERGATDRRLRSGFVEQIRGRCVEAAQKSSLELAAAHVEGLGTARGRRSPARLREFLELLSSCRLDRGHTLYLSGSSPRVWQSSGVERWLADHPRVGSHHVSRTQDWLRLANFWWDHQSEAPELESVRANEVGSTPLIWMRGEGIVD